MAPLKKVDAIKPLRAFEPNPSSLIAFREVALGASLHHYNGISWSPVTSGIGGVLEGIWGSSGSYVFAVGSASTSNLTIRDTILDRNSVFDEIGGGIYNLGTLVFEKSLKTRGLADAGGGLLNKETDVANMTNVTLSNNRANGYGGAVSNGDPFNGSETPSISMKNVTINNNRANTQGGGIFNKSGGGVTLKNTILGDVQKRALIISPGYELSETFWYYSLGLGLEKERDIYLMHHWNAESVKNYLNRSSPLYLPEERIVVPFGLNVYCLDKKQAAHFSWMGFPVARVKDDLYQVKQLD